jgi:hypothetical protein
MGFSGLDCPQPHQKFRPNKTNDFDWVKTLG